MKTNLLATMLAMTLATAGCGGGDSASAQTGGADGKPSEMVKLSQFGGAGSCAIAVGPDGTLHALFSDQKSYGKPAFLYYRASKDNGATWSEAKTLSDDESVLSAGYCRVLVDKAGRIYAIWKYVNPNELLEGPNGFTNGFLAVRVMEGGTWSKPRIFGDEHKPMVSWFATLAPDGKVNVIYSRADEGQDWAKRGAMYSFANNVDQLVFDGAGEPAVTHLQVAQPVLTQAEFDARQAAGKNPAYDEMNPKNDGPWNLNGYVADDGRPRFLAEKYTNGSDFPRILRFDGKGFETYYEYKQQYLPFNTFHCPPVLLLAGDGKAHVIRKPEVGENELVRDYVVQDGKPGDKTDVITNDAPTAKVHGWWASALTGGRIAAMAAVEPNVKVSGPNDLYVALFDGKGAWSKPVNITDNAARETFAANHGVSQSTRYEPTYAEAATLKDGSVGVILVNREQTISGFDTVGITGSGRAVTGTSSISTASPYVSFVKVKG